MIALTKSAFTMISDVEISGDHWENQLRSSPTGGGGDPDSSREKTSQLHLAVGSPGRAELSSIRDCMCLERSLRSRGCFSRLKLVCIGGAGYGTARTVDKARKESTLMTSGSITHSPMVKHTAQRRSAQVAPWKPFQRRVAKIIKQHAYRVKNTS